MLSVRDRSCARREDHLTHFTERRPHAQVYELSVGRWLCGKARRQRLLILRGTLTRYVETQ